MNNLFAGICFQCLTVNSGCDKNFDTFMPTDLHAFNVNVSMALRGTQCSLFLFSTEGNIRKESSLSAIFYIDCAIYSYILQLAFIEAKRCGGQLESATPSPTDLMYILQVGVPGFS